MATPTLIVFRNSFTICTRVSSLGLVFVGAGAFLRLWSYHTLGELFTFEVVVRPDRRLITSGPHADTRHIRASRCSSVGSSCSWGMGRLSGEGSRARGSLILRMCSYHLCAGTGSWREIWKCVGRVRGGGAVSSRPVRLVIREDSVIWVLTVLQPRSLYPNACILYWLFIPFACLLVDTEVKISNEMRALRRHVATSEDSDAFQCSPSCQLRITWCRCRQRC